MVQSHPARANPGKDGGRPPSDGVGNKEETMSMRNRHTWIAGLGTVLLGLLYGVAHPVGAANAQPAQQSEQVQPWGLPPLPQGIGTIEKFADVGNTPQGKFLEGASFDAQGNLWFVAISTGWVSYLTPDGKLVPGFNCNPPADVGQDCEPQGTRWHDGKLYLTTRHRGILVYDPATKKLSTLVYTYRNQLFKGPNDLDFDAEGNLFFTDPWGTGPGPNLADRTGAVYQYSRDGVLRKVIDTGAFPNGVAVSPDDSTLAVADYATGRVWYNSFLSGPNVACNECASDPQHLTFFFAKAGTYVPGNGGPDGIHYDVHGDLWAQLHGMGGMIEIDPKGLILGFVPIPNGDIHTTNFAFGGPDNQYIFMEGASTGTFWRFKAPYPGLIGPGGNRLPEQH
jgi:gluconolactonase